MSANALQSGDDHAPSLVGPSPTIYFYHPPGTSDTPPGTSDTPVDVDVFKVRSGWYVWIVQTYAHLWRLGFRCELTDKLPDSGIVIAHRQVFSNRMVPSARQLFVCVVADFFRHPFAQLHILQNPTDPMLIRPIRAWPATCVSHWPECGLIPRDPSRGGTLENVAYFGLPGRLAPQLRTPEFSATLRRHGFSFRIVPRRKWNDYRDTDAVLAVRTFADVASHKYPPSKLYNSWIAGVPALLGKESAYRAERRGELDYFEVRSVEDIVRTLLRLRDDSALFKAVQRNCARRARDVSAPRIAQEWTDFLIGCAVPAYEEWVSQSALRRGVHFATRAVRYAGFALADSLVRAGGYLRQRLRALLP